MSKIQNENLTAMFDWIKSPMGLFLLLCSIALCCIVPGFLVVFLLIFIAFCVNAPVKSDSTSNASIPQKTPSAPDVQKKPTRIFLGRFSGFLLLYFSIFAGLGSVLNNFLSLFNFSRYGSLYNIYRTATIFIGFPVVWGLILLFPVWLPLLAIQGKAISSLSPSKIHPLHLCILFLSGLSYFILLGVAITLNNMDLHDSSDLSLLFTFVFAVFIISLSAKSALKKRIFMKKTSDVQQKTTIENS